jgi:hypothetical protein
LFGCLLTAIISDEGFIQYCFESKLVFFGFYFKGIIYFVRIIRLLPICQPSKYTEHGGYFMPAFLENQIVQVSPPMVNWLNENFLVRVRHEKLINCTCYRGNDLSQIMVVGDGAVMDFTFMEIAKPKVPNIARLWRNEYDLRDFPFFSFTDKPENSGVFKFMQLVSFPNHWQYCLGCVTMVREGFRFQVSRSFVLNWKCIAFLEWVLWQINLCKNDVSRLLPET